MKLQIWHYEWMLDTSWAKSKPSSRRRLLFIEKSLGVSWALSINLVVTFEPIPTWSVLNELTLTKSVGAIATLQIQAITISSIGRGSRIGTGSSAMLEALGTAGWPRRPLGPITINLTWNVKKPELKNTCLKRASSTEFGIHPHVWSLTPFSFQDQFPIPPARNCLKDYCRSHLTDPDLSLSQGAQRFYSLRVFLPSVTINETMSLSLFQKLSLGYKPSSSPYEQKESKIGRESEKISHNFVRTSKWDKNSPCLQPLLS